MEKFMYYTIYKITNQVDGKFYIGSHKTKDLNDGYMGSGKYLKHAQEKYGIENFTKEILFVFETSEEMYAKEAELVNEDFLATENTYNLKIGGHGGFDYLNSTKRNLYGSNGKRGFGGENLKPSVWTRDDLTEDDIENIKRKISNTMKSQYASGRPVSFKGKTHSDETKKIISEKSSEHQSGEGNSQYGTMWITDGVVNKKIKKVDKIPAGFRKGAVFRK